MRREPLTTNAIRAINARVNQTLRAMGQPDSDELKAAAALLKKSFRQVLSRRGGARPVVSLKTRKLRPVGGTPSAPGQAPRRQLGQLARSVRDGVAGARRRVAVTWFTAPLLEGGVDTSLPTRSGIRRRAGGVAKRRLRIAPRPFAQQAVTAVQDDLAGVMVDLAGVRLKALEE